jgi:hypothetical protein
MPVFTAAFTLRGYVFDRYQDIELEIGAFDFFRVRLRIKAFL